MATQVAGELYESITGQLFEIGRQLRQPNGYPFNPEELKKHLQAGIEGRFNNKQRANVYSLSVNYDQPIADAIAAGKYDWVNNNITQKNFPTNRTGKAEVEIELVHFNRAVSTKEALAELDKRGIRPAELHELLALGASHPELQREFPVIGLGSVWRSLDGGRDCPCLYWGGSRRSLNLYWLERGWDGYCRFAAVRK